jgi:hypothetical protein
MKFISKGPEADWLAIILIIIFATLIVSAFICMGYNYESNFFFFR